MANGAEGYPLSIEANEGFNRLEMTKEARKILSDYDDNIINITGVISALWTLQNQTKVIITKVEDGCTYYREVLANGFVSEVEDYQTTKTFNDNKERKLLKVVTRKGELLIAELMAIESGLSEEVEEEENRIAYRNSSERHGVSYSDIHKYYNTAKLKSLDSKLKTVRGRIEAQQNLFTFEEWNDCLFKDLDGNEWVHCWYHESKEDYNWERGIK